MEQGATARCAARCGKAQQALRVWVCSSPGATRFAVRICRVLGLKYLRGSHFAPRPLTVTAAAAITTTTTATAAATTITTTTTTTATASGNYAGPMVVVTLRILFRLSLPLARVYRLLFLPGWRAHALASDGPKDADALRGRTTRNGLDGKRA